MIKNEIVTVADRQWKILHAVDMDTAFTAIKFARILGKVRGKYVPDKYIDKHTKSLAEVVQLNSDGSERQPESLYY